MKTRSLLISFIVFSLVFIIASGCNDGKQASPTSPAGDTAALSNATHGDEGVRFAYQAGTTPGIALTADFSRYHKKDQPWAATGLTNGWFVNAEWRDADRHAIAQETASWTIDANGVGTAHLSAAFLNAVFQAATERYQQDKNDTTAWFHRPGLYLNIFADDATYKYYDISCPMSNWSFGGSLSDLVEQLQLKWWPGLPALTNVAAQANLGDPITFQCASSTPTAPSPTVLACGVSGGTMGANGCASDICVFPGVAIKDACDNFGLDVSCDECSSSGFGCKCVPKE